MLVTAFGYASQTVFASGGVLPRHKTHPSRKLTATAEATGFCHARCNRAGDDRPDAGDSRQTLADRVALVPGHELLLDGRNRAFQLLDLCGEHFKHWRAKSGSRASLGSRTTAISLPTLRKPCGAITPNSAKCPRKAFTSAVRWRTSRSRPRCSSSAACCSAVLAGTNRIVGRTTASQIASASAASFLFRLT